MQFTAGQISALINGTVEGDSDAMVTKIAKIEEGVPESITFLGNPKYENYLYSTKASVVIISNHLELKEPVNTTLIRVDDPYSALSVLLAQYEKVKAKKSGIDQMVSVHESAIIDKTAYVGSFCVVGENSNIGAHCQIHPQVFIGNNVKIGKDTILNTGVKIYDDSIIGDNCILHANVVVGSDGFGFAPQKDGTLQKVPQTGNVIIEDEVEIGAQTVIDRASIGSTIIRKGVKLDNLIQVAHNVEIGANTVIAAQSGISGSAKIGESCLIGGQVGLVGHIQIANGVKINAQSGVAKSVTEEGKAITGSPAFAFKDAIRSYAVYKKLPDIESRIVNLENKINKDQNA